MMLATDEDAVICDFAETYHVLDIGALDLQLAATLAAGLAPDSRIVRKMSGISPIPVGVLLARIFDELALLRWLNSKDGADGVNPPQSLLAALTGQTAEPSGGSILTAATGAEFDALRAQLLEKARTHDGP